MNIADRQTHKGRQTGRSMFLSACVCERERQTLSSLLAGITTKYNINDKALM